MVAKVFPLHLMVEVSMCCVATRQSYLDSVIVPTIRALRNKQLVLRRVRDEMRVHCVR